MNIILFGPPGIGKSTIIGDLKLASCKAIDLEDVYPSSIRFQLPSMVDRVAFGGADLNPKRKYHNAIKIILVTSQAVYDHRRAVRDLRVHGKSAQKHHLISDWLDDPSNYDMYLDVTEPLTTETIELISDILQSDNIDPSSLHSIWKNYRCADHNVSQLLPTSYCGDEKKGGN